jgi:hypothetical protein
MSPTNRTKCKPKGGGGSRYQPDNPVTVNPAAANNTDVATSSASKRSHFEHGTPANATKNNTTEPNLPATLAMHPATANGANVPPGGDMATTIGGSDSIEYGNSTLLSLPLLPRPGATRHNHCLSTCWTAKSTPGTQRLRMKLQGSSTMPPILPAEWKQPWTPP